MTRAMPAEGNDASAVDFADRRPARVERRESSARRDATSVDGYVQQITAAWHTAVASILETGRLLIKAKDDLDRGEFIPMVEERLPFGIRTAQKLMKIASNPVLSNATHESHLPPSVETLHLLSTLPEDRLEQWIADGTINTEMQRADVLALERIERQIARSEPNRIELALREAEGTIHNSLRDALDTLGDIMARFPDPLSVVPYLTFDADLLGSSRYLTDLHAARERSAMEAADA